MATLAKPRKMYYTQYSKTVEPHSPLSLKLQIYKFSAEEYILSKWKNGKLEEIDRRDLFFRNLDESLFIKVLACSLYQQKDNDGVKFFNRLWGKQMIELGAPKEPKYAISRVPIEALDKFTTEVRNIYGW